jgi:hypothetical protein
MRSPLISLTSEEFFGAEKKYHCRDLLIKARCNDCQSNKNYNIKVVASKELIIYHATISHFLLFLDQYVYLRIQHTLMLLEDLIYHLIVLLATDIEVKGTLAQLPLHYGIVVWAATVGFLAYYK